MEEALGCTLGVVGGGSMGGAIARGLVDSGTLDAAHVLVAEPSAARRDELASWGLTCVADGSELLGAGADVVLLAVKPQVIGSVMAPLAEGLEGLLVISIAAGVTTATIEAALPGSRVVRVMPNLPVQVRSGASAVCAGSRATDEDVELARTLFAALGSAHVMSEAQLDVAGAVSGCAPAFFALFVDTLTRAGVLEGLPAAACRELVEATMRGTAEQLLRSGEHPRAYVEKVTSPGGTTAAALCELEPALAEGSYEGVAAALRRTRELAGSAAGEA